MTTDTLQLASHTRNLQWYNGLSDRLRNRSKRVRTPVELLRSHSGKYPCERNEPPYPIRNGLNSTTTVLLGEWIWY